MYSVLKIMFMCMRIKNWDKDDRGSPKNHINPLTFIF